MSRRSQARRRRAYGRRQHEVRERRSDGVTDSAWPLEAGTDGLAAFEWQASERDDDAPLYDTYRSPDR